MYRDKSSLEMIAALAADGYLSKKADLNDSLKKLAADESLTPSQIEYVAGQANQKVFARLFALDKMASYDFPLADPHKVLGDLQMKTASSQTNEMDLDYLSPPTNQEKVASFDPLKVMGFSEDLIKTSAVARKELRHQLQGRFEKMAHLKESLEMDVIATQSKLEQAELRFIKEARDLILENPSSERAQGMDTIAEFLRGCDRTDVSQALMRKLSTVMLRQGLMKEADLKAPEQYISEKLPARITNGRHSLYITIKTIHQHGDELRELRNRYEIVDSSLPVVKEKIREL